MIILGWRRLVSEKHAELGEKFEMIEKKEKRLYAGDLHLNVEKKDVFWKAGLFMETIYHPL